MLYIRHTIGQEYNVVFYKRLISIQVTFTSSDCTKEELTTVLRLAECSMHWDGLGGRKFCHRPGKLQHTAQPLQLLGLGRAQADAHYHQAYLGYTRIKLCQ